MIITQTFTMARWQIVVKTSGPRSVADSEERGELKRTGTDARPHTSLTPYRWAKPACVLELCVILLLFVGT